MCVVASKPVRVDNKKGITKDGIKLEHGDVYFYCYWLDYEETTISGAKTYVMCDQEAPELVHLAGAVIGDPAQGRGDEGRCQAAYYFPSEAQRGAGPVRDANGRVIRGPQCAGPQCAGPPSMVWALYPACGLSTVSVVIRAVVCLCIRVRTPAVAVKNE